jgi:hypothetical protein
MIILAAKLLITSTDSIYAPIYAEIDRLKKQLDYLRDDPHKSIETRTYCNKLRRELEERILELEEIIATHI